MKISLTEGREIALQQIKEKAERLGANAIVRVDLDFETLRDGMMMVVAIGTAVRMKD